jgi:hypothetical protein
MPITKKVWLTIGNSILGIWILSATVFSFYLLPRWATHDVMPYTKTVMGAMKALLYAPCLVPLCAIVLCLLMSLGQIKQSVQQFALSTSVVMLLVSGIGLIFYAAAEDDFLTHYPIWQGSCQPGNAGVSVNGNEKGLYINFTCDNQPGHVFKVWDPEVIAYVVNHPGESPLQYRLSVKHTLLPVESASLEK